ncbi:MAG: porin [Pseudomonadota bacterium]
MRTLLISTALILNAGMSAAQVEFDGYGRFGLGYNEGRGGNDNLGDPFDSELALVSRFRLNIEGKTNTDSGVQFSARVRLQADDSPNENEQRSATLNGARYQVRYESFRMFVGNTGGAIDAGQFDGFEPGLEEFTGQYSGIEYDYLNDSSTGAGSNAVLAEYIGSRLGVAASYDPDVENGNDRWDVSVEYDFDGPFGVWAAYGENEDDQSLLVGVLTAEFDRLAVNVLLGKEDLNLAPGVPEIDGVVYGLSGRYEIGAATNLLFSYGSGEGSSDFEAYAIGFIHDLGGGVSLRGGIGSEGPKDGESEVTGDLGVWFNF